MNIALLEKLREAGGGFVSLAGLGPDVDQVEADLFELASFGFAMERHPYHGVAYRGPALRLCPDQIEWELGTRIVGRRVAVWNRVTSTNDLACRAAGSLANEGLAILAEGQTAGRGRRGRTWTAPEGSSILMSVLLFPPPTLDDPAWLTALGAVAVAEVVAGATGLDARIKWPNDVRVNGRKIAGILVERGQGTVLGIGLNVNLAPDDFPEDLRPLATSLRALAGHPFDRSDLTRGLLRGLDRWYHLGVEHGPDSLTGAWRDRSEHLNRDVEVATSGGPVVGRLVGLDLLGGLTLDLPEGRVLVAGRDVLAIVNRAAGSTDVA